MFIIWGTKYVSKLVKDGIVVRKRCTKCKDTRLLYEHKREKWFTLFYIPLIPYGYEGSSFLKCIVCDTEYYISPDDFDMNDKSRQLDFDDRVTLKCPSCSVTLKVKPFDKEEVKIRCKGCGHIFTVKKNYRSY